MSDQVCCLVLKFDEVFKLNHFLFFVSPPILKDLDSNCLSLRSYYCRNFVTATHWVAAQRQGSEYQSGYSKPIY